MSGAAFAASAAAIRRGKALVIVAIGSSSTEGVGASDTAHTYPALLGEELRRRLPPLGDYRVPDRTPIDAERW